MGMQYETPDGSKMTEWFKSMDELKERKKAVEQAGGKVTRVVEIHTNPRYPTPHEGKQEVERRRKQIERVNAKITEAQREAG